MIQQQLTWFSHNGSSFCYFLAILFLYTYCPSYYEN